MNDQTIEHEIQTKGLNAPRLRPDDIDENIICEYYFTAKDGVVGADPEQAIFHRAELSLMTFCVVILRNGFTVTGESACVSPENFDAQIGRKIARQNAVHKIWPLMGYALKEKLST